MLPRKGDFVHWRPSYNGRTPEVRLCRSNLIRVWGQDEEVDKTSSSTLVVVVGFSHDLAARKN
jgi:hypothetical protein